MVINSIFPFSHNVFKRFLSHACYKSALCGKGLIKTFTKRQILDSSKLKEFADNNFKVDENGRKFSKWIETLWEKEKLLITSNFSFSYTVFKRLVLQTRKNQGLFGKGLINKTSICMTFQL